MIVTGKLKPISLFLSAPIPPQQPQHYTQISHMSNGRGHETEEMSNQSYYDHDREQYSRARVSSSAPDNSYRSPYESRESPNVRKLLSLHVMFFLNNNSTKVVMEPVLQGDDTKFNSCQQSQIQVVLPFYQPNG